MKNIYKILYYFFLFAYVFSAVIFVADKINIAVVCLLAPLPVIFAMLNEKNKYIKLGIKKEDNIFAGEIFTLIENSLFIFLLPVFLAKHYIVFFILWMLYVISLGITRKAPKILLEDEKEEAR